MVQRFIYNKIKEIFNRPNSKLNYLKQYLIFDIRRVKPLVKFIVHDNLTLSFYITISGIASLVLLMTIYRYFKPKYEKTFSDYLQITSDSTKSKDSYQDSTVMCR